jgi:hypothetical protein
LKGIIKKVITPKKGTNSKKDNEIKKEKSRLLNSLESLRTIQTLSSGTIIEKIMKFGAEEIILPSDRSLAVYEFDNETNKKVLIFSLLYLTRYCQKEKQYLPFLTLLDYFHLFHYCRKLYLFLCI